MPKVSVIMPVFNGEAYLAQAIDSVLTQTLADLELLVIDDGSTDSCADIVRSYADSRIRFIQNPRNLGLPLTRNRGIEEAKGEYLAFLDSDDIALPQRLQLQVEFLDANPGIAAVGAGVRPIDRNGMVSGADWLCPGTPAFCKAMLLFRAYLVTSTFTARAAVLRDIQFDPDIALAEDFNLYNRLCESHRLLNLPQTLVRFRVHPGSTTATQRQRLRDSLELINRRQLATLGIAVSQHELRLHRHIEWLDMAPSVALLQDVSRWLLTLIEHNERCGVYDQAALRQAAASRWHAVCEDALRKGVRAAWIQFYRVALWRDHRMTLADHLKLAARLVVPRRKQPERI